MIKRIGIFLLFSTLAFSQTNTFLTKPFVGEYSLLAIFDHEYPIYNAANKGDILSFWGEHIKLAYDGHKGYDWDMPIGTAIYAAADGLVIFAGAKPATICPSENRRIRGGNQIEIEHNIGTDTYISSYLHLDRVLVTQGSTVSTGQLIGYSGQSGTCVGPHLHFELDKVLLGNRIALDPYGWQASFKDPWQAHPKGTASSYLWKPGQAPELFRESNYHVNQSNIPIVVVKIRSIGVFDDLYPNNEFVDIAIPTKYNKPFVDLSGYSISNNYGRVFKFDDGFGLEPNHSLRIYSGRGNNTPDTLFWNSKHEIWGNSGFCLTIRDNYQHIIGTYRHKMPKAYCR